MNTPCEKTEIITIIRDDVKEIKNDLKDIIKFKNQALAIVISFSTVIPFVVSILTTFLKK